MKFWEQFKNYLLYIFITAMLGIFLVLIKNDIAVGVGISLIASATLAALEIIRIKVDTKVSDKMANIITEGGLSKVYNNRDITHEYAELVIKANKSIDICGYALSGFYESHKDTLLKMLKKKPNVIMRILFVDPESKISEAKEKIEGKEAGSYKLSYNTFKSTFADYPNVEIRTIDFPLSSMIFKVDDVLYVGPQFSRRSSKTSYTMKLDEGKWVYNQFVEEFNDMWSVANSRS